MSPELAIVLTLGAFVIVGMMFVNILDWRRRAREEADHAD